MFFSFCHSVSIFEINYRLCFNQKYYSKLPVNVMLFCVWQGGGRGDQKIPLQVAKISYSSYSLYFLLMPQVFIDLWSDQRSC